MQLSKSVYPFCCACGVFLFVLCCHGELPHLTVQQLAEAIRLGESTVSSIEMNITTIVSQKPFSGRAAAYNEKMPSGEPKLQATAGIYRMKDRYRMESLAYARSYGPAPLQPPDISGFAPDRLPGHRAYNGEFWTERLEGSSAGLIDSKRRLGLRFGDMIGITRLYQVDSKGRRYCDEIVPRNNRWIMKIDPNGSYDGMECYIVELFSLETDPFGKQIICRLWICPKSAFCVAKAQWFDRRSKFLRGHSFHGFKQINRGVWLPSRAIVQKTVETINATYSYISVNKAIDDSEFVVKFIPGSDVSDERTNTFWEVPRSDQQIDELIAGVGAKASLTRSDTTGMRREISRAPEPASPMSAHGSVTTPGVEAARATGNDSGKGEPDSRTNVLWLLGGIILMALFLHIRNRRATGSKLFILVALFASPFSISSQFESYLPKLRIASDDGMCGIYSSLFCRYHLTGEVSMAAARRIFADGGREFPGNVGKSTISMDDIRYFLGQVGLVAIPVKGMTVDLLKRAVSKDGVGAVFYTEPKGHSGHFSAVVCGDDGKGFIFDFPKLRPTEWDSVEWEAYTRAGSRCVLVADSRRRMLELRRTCGDLSGIDIPPGPKLLFGSLDVVITDEDVIDNEAVEKEVVFTNSGPGTLTLALRKVCCGVQAEISKTIVKEGASSSVSVKIPRRLLDGPFEKAIYVASNDGDSPLVQIRLLSRVTPRAAGKALGGALLWHPSELALSASSEGDRYRSRTLGIAVQCGNTDSSIKSIHVSSNIKGLRLAPKKSEQNGAKWLVSLDFSSVALGPFSGTVRMVAEMEGDRTEMKVPVSGSILPDLHANPATVFMFQRPRHGKPNEGLFRVRSRSGMAVSVRDVSIECETVGAVAKVEAVDASAASFRIQVEPRGVKAVAGFEGRVTLKVRAEGENDEHYLVVPFRGVF